MKSFALPETVGALILDIDRTLYDNDEYAAEQVESQYRRAADLWAVPVEEARERVRAWRERYAAEHDGAVQSLGNSLAGLGISIETSVKWRRIDIRPADYLLPDPQLAECLAGLAEHVPMVAVTNNPVSVGVAALQVIGVSEIVGHVVGLDSTGYSKPHPEPFREAVRRLGVDPSMTVSVGDRFHVDIKPALDLGMGGLLVDGVRDVYVLPSILADQLPGRVSTR